MILEPGSDRYDSRLRAEAEAELCRRGWTGIFVLPVALFAVLFTTSVPHKAPAVSAAALIALTLICLLRLYDTVRFATYGEAQRRAWKLRFWLTFQGSAAVFSLLGSYVVVELFGRDWEPVFYLLALAGVTAGGVTALTPDLRIMRQYIVVQLLPIGVAFLMTDFWEPGVAVMIFAVYWLGQGTAYSKAYWEALHAKAHLQAKSEDLERVVGELTEAGERFRSAFEASPIGMGIVRSDGKLLQGNQQLATTLGLSRRDLRGICLPTIFAPEEGRKFLAALQTGQELECELRRPDGGLVWLLFKAGDQPEKDEGLDCFIGQFVDITQRKQAEATLYKTQKMQSLGVLAAGIAHELNTPLQFVTDNVHFLSDSWRDLDEVFARLSETKRSLLAEPERRHSSRDLLESCPTPPEDFLEEGREALEDTAQGLRRMSAVVSSIRAVTYGGEAKKRPVDLTATISNALAVSSAAWKDFAQLETHFQENLPMVEGDESELGQVFLNLIVNAAQAMEEVARLRPLVQAKLSILTRHDGGFVEVRVSDSGPGIDKAIEDKIFDPFFTTKEVGKGTGQGLAFTRSAVSRHGGTITFESKPNEGTTFVVRLPLIAA